MHFQFIVAPPTPSLTPPPAPPPVESTSELLRELLDVQREQLGLMRAVHSEDGNLTRWKNFFSRWRDEFGHLPDTLRDALPKLESAYLRVMDDLTRYLQDDETGNLDDDFSLSEFLDRFAMRAGQLHALLNMLGQMVEATRVKE